MGTVLMKDFLREIGKTLNRFLSIFCIVLIGVAFFSGVKATAPDMEYTADQYYDTYNMMDIQVMSTLGLTDDDIEEIRKTANVEQVQAGYFTDVVTTIDSSEVVFKIHSLPAGYLTDPDGDYLNKVKLVEGRLPEKAGECVIEQSQNVDSGLSIGDTFTVSSGTKEEITDGVLARDTFTVVGKVVTPYYMTYEKGSSQIGGGSVDFYMMISEEDFAYPVYTEALIKVAGARELNTYSGAYAKLIEGVVSSLENLGADRASIRVDELRKIAYQQLADGQAEYDEKEQEFNTQISEAEQKLNDSLAQLSEGEATLAAERKNFEKEYAEGQQEIRDGEKELAKGEAEYQASLAQYNALMEESGDDLESLNEIARKLNELYGSGEEALAKVEETLKDPNLSSGERTQWEMMKVMYQLLLGLSADGVDTVNGFNDLAQYVVIGTEAQLKAARAELDAGYADLEKGKSDLAAGKRTAEAEFSKAEKELAAGWEEYNAGKAEFDTQKADGEKQLQDAREQIIRAENEIEKLEEPQWYVLDRNSNISYVDYRMTVERMDAIAAIFPVFFFLVAALVCLTSMTRMVDEQRGIIGTYKALGYGDKAIAFKYVAYAGIASLLGGCAGLALGMNFFPQTIFQSWSLMYQMPAMSTVNQIPLMIASVLMGVIVTVAASYFACARELKCPPSQLMRPKAPKQGKGILLERVTWLWKRLTFSQKVTARNIFRYKKRFWMTVIGIAGCSALLLAGLGLDNSISQVVNKQFKEIFQYDMNLRFSAASEDAEREDIIELLGQKDQVDSVMQVAQVNAQFVNGDENIGVTLIVPSDSQMLGDYISLRDRSSQRPISLKTSGVVVTEKLAKQLGVSVGDSVKVTNNEGISKKLTVTDITENYVFHYAYISQEAYQEAFRLSAPMDSLLIKLIDTNPEMENRLGDELITHEQVGSVEFYSEVASEFDEKVDALNMIVLLIIICAGLLAFVVLYNLTNINISERLREIATIKVLGFYNREVASYVYRENLVLTFVGALAGLGLGTLLHRFIMESIEQDGIMFGYHIEPLSFLYAFLITFAFAIIVSVFMYRKLVHISMVESLKSVE